MSREKEEIRREEASREAWRGWLQQRVEVIHSKVTAHAVLRHGGVNLRSDGEEQFSCPFHGVDTKPSARVYPEDARSHSHAWCFVCQERWDAISLWKKFYPGEEDKSFSRVLREIEQAFGIVVGEVPTEATLSRGRSYQSLDSFDTLYEVVESRLIRAWDAYDLLDDMTGYLSACQVLHKLRFRVDNRQLKPERGEEVLRRLLDRIAQKVRSCPVG